MPHTGNVLSVGEILVDFVSTESGRTLEDAPGFVKCAGGAPANVAVGIARLGTRSSYIGNVGEDSFGRFLVSEMRAAGVETTGIHFDPRYRTRLAFVSLKKDGDRDFAFWESDPADEHLEYSNVKLGLVHGATIVNIGSFLLLRNPSRTAVMKIARRARELGKEVCYDPNLRLSLWNDHDEARSVMTKMIRLATIVRMNDQEAEFFTGKRDIDVAAEAIRHMGPRLVVITLGQDGSYFQMDRCSGVVGGFRVNAVDTTGCGDGFLAGLLHGLVASRKNISDLSLDELYSLCEMSNAVGALVATKRGGISAMPTWHELERFLKLKISRPVDKVRYSKYVVR